MSQPVKLSDELVLEARQTAELAERSIAGQIEYWAQIGRILEPLLGSGQALALRRSQAVASLADCMDAIDTPEGRQRFMKYLESQPFPHYEVAPDAPGLIVRVEEDGTRTTGRFVGNEFRAIDVPANR